jgi:arylformamidase
MIGPACILDVGRDAHSLITREELEAHRGAIERTGRVLIRTGWSDKFGSPAFWTDFPTLSPDAAQFLVECRVVFLGMDTPSPSVIDLHEVHRILLGAGCVLAECLVGLTQLSSEETFIVCLPLKLVGLDGAPARIVAFEEPVLSTEQ